jgi:uncharacterized membrane protein YphA (DoxX/SURF4 family)
MNKYQTMKEFSPAVLRIGLALVMYWFGFFQIFNPDAFAYLVPEAIANIFGSAARVSYLNGIAEVILATFLILGLYTRIVAWILAIHLVAITIAVGWSPTGARNFGLTVAFVSMALHGKDRYTLDHKWRS